MFIVLSLPLNHSLAHSFTHHRHWRELSISPIYELTLLHWEQQLQKDLGKTIMELIAGLGGAAAEVGD